MIPRPYYNNNKKIKHVFEPVILHLQPSGVRQESSGRGQTRSYTTQNRNQRN